MERSKIENNYSEAVTYALRSRDVYSMFALEGLSRHEISQRIGVSPSTVWRIIRTFEAENPQLSEEMKKKGKDVSPEDFRKLLAEVNNLKAELKNFSYVTKHALYPHQDQHHIFQLKNQIKKNN